MDKRQIVGNHVRALHSFMAIYMDKWVRHKKNRNRISPGQVENIELSLLEAVCTVRWANNTLTREHGQDLHILY